jgi:hypothetical protein
VSKFASDLPSNSLMMVEGAVAADGSWAGRTEMHMIDRSIASQPADIVRSSGRTNRVRCRVIVIALSIAGLKACPARMSGLLASGVTF